MAKVFQKYETLTTGKPTQGYLATAQKFFSKPVASTTDAPYVDAVKNEEINHLKKNPGFSIESSFARNFRSSSDDQLDVIYRERVQAGLDWNIFKNGFFENRNKANRAELEKSIYDLQSKQDVKSQEISYRSAEIIYRFNAEKIRLLRKRKEILNSKSGLINELFNQKEISNLDYIHLKQSLIDISSTLDVYEGYNEIFKKRFSPDSLEPVTLPLIDFRFDEFLKNYSAIGQTEDSILKLELKDLELQRSLVNNIGLKAFSRYNYYDVFYSSATRNFYSAGLNLSIPLSSVMPKSLANAKAELMKHKLSSNDNEQLAEMMNYFYEFRFSLKQYLDLYEKTMEWSELLRIERVRMQYNDAEFNPIKALKLLDELLDQRIELVDLKQVLYLKLLRISKYNPTVNIGNFITQVQLDSLEMAAVKFSFNKSVYIWSNAFENNPPKFISEYLFKNSIANAIISVNADAALSGLNAIDALSAAGIKTEMLISNNDLVLKTDAEIQTYFNKIFIASHNQSYNTIHLDIEPHTFSDWQQNKESYRKKYRHLLQVVKKICDNKKKYLAVSVPLNNEAAFIQSIKDLCTKVYVMAYETKNSETVTKKLNENFSSVNSKLTIALRTNDFSSVSEMENYMKLLSDKTGINRFAIHDLTRLMKLDE